MTLLTDTILSASTSILNLAPCPVIQYRVKKEILLESITFEEERDYQSKIEESRHAQALFNEQLPDGSWGRFHSMDSRQRRIIPTTETAVDRAISLGINSNNPRLQQTRVYIQKIIAGKRPFPDPPEKNDRWLVGMRLFLASTLSKLDPAAPEVEIEREKWVEIASYAYRSGNYSGSDEDQAHILIHGVPAGHGYLRINGRYQLQLIGSKVNSLTQQTGHALLEWLWNKPEGIGYLCVPLNIPPAFPSSRMDLWLRSLEILSHYLPFWVNKGASIIEWLLSQRGENGLWDFGDKPGRTHQLPLSDHWKTRNFRCIDWSVRVLKILRAYYDHI